MSASLPQHPKNSPFAELNRLLPPLYAMPGSDDDDEDEDDEDEEDEDDEEEEEDEDDEEE